MLKITQLNMITTQLESERLRLKSLLASSLDMRLEDAPGEGRRKDDCLSRNELRSLSFDHRAKLLRRLHNINDALHQLTIGTYGHCIECGVAISNKRLAKDPAITHCSGCLPIIEPLKLPIKLSHYLYSC